MKQRSTLLKSFFIACIIILGFSMFPWNMQTAQSEPNNESLKAVFMAEKVPVEVFVRNDCKHCKEEKEFFIELSLRRDDFYVRFHNISEEEHHNHWKQLTELEQLPKVTPITLVGNTIIQGYDDAYTTGKRIEELIESSVGKHTHNFEAYIAAGGSGNIEPVANGVCDEEAQVCEIDESPLLKKLPFLGVVDISEYSLPVLSMILGFIDGFNPCAMWVLVTFLMVLVNVGDRKKMWMIAGLFIFAEAIMYYLILNVWFTAWDFVGLDNLVTPIVGLVAIGGGMFFLYEWKTSEGACKVTSLKQRAKTTKKIHTLVEAEMTLLTILGIIGLAFSVNIIEFACSIGIPQTFTKILDMNDLGMLTKQFYMAIYILFYMIDDFIIFGIALYSFEKIGLTTKYAKMANLAGGILMILLGTILMFYPELLVI